MASPVEIVLDAQVAQFSCFTRGRMIRYNAIVGTTPALYQGATSCRCCRAEEGIMRVMTWIVNAIFGAGKIYWA